MSMCAYVCVSSVYLCGVSMYMWEHVYMCV